MGNSVTPSLLIAGGGTGGHVLAGVAVAEEWRRCFPTGQILFVGSVGGIEEKLVPRAGFQLKVLHIGALKGTGFIKKIITFAQLPFAFWMSAFILLRLKPKAVLGVGGYSSGPLVLTAWALSWLWEVKVAILEQNAVPGFTNKILGNFSHPVFTTFPGVDMFFPLGKTIVSGNPTRSEIQFFPSAPRDPFTIFIFGGSQGAVGINSLVLEALPFLKEHKDKLRLIHQTGEQDYGRVCEGYKIAGFGEAGRIEKFIFDMPAAYKEASLLICRAGSSTLSEIAATGRASILIPFPFASDNHQEKNAQIFEKAGAATLMNQLKAKGKDLADSIRAFMEDSARLDSMEKSSHTLYTPGATNTIIKNLSSFK